MGFKVEPHVKNSDYLLTYRPPQPQGQYFKDDYPSNISKFGSKWYPNFLHP